MAELSALIDRHMLRPFVWGEADCCLAVANVLRDGGWPDPAAPYRGRYATRAEARAVMAGTTAEVAAREAERLGWPEIDPAEALDWDAGVIGMSLAIRSGGWWFAKSRAGYVMRRTVARAWRPV